MARQDSLAFWPAGWRLVEAADPAAVGAHVASLLLQERLQRPERPLGLATGRTMEPVYAALVAQVDALPATDQQRLRSQWLSFNLDEYVLTGASLAGSFAAAMDQHLRIPLGLAAHQVRLPDGTSADPAAEADRYRQQLTSAGGIGLQLLGLGLNGHVGFNEPPCPVDAPCRCLELSATTRRQNASAFGGDPEAVPRRAITLGLAEILAAQRLVLVVTGAAKAAILGRLIASAPSADLPASWLRGHPNLELVVDRAAAAALLPAAMPG